MSNILSDSCCKIRTENKTNGNDVKFRLNSEVKNLLDYAVNNLKRSKRRIFMYE